MTTLLQFPTHTPTHEQDSTVSHDVSPVFIASNNQINDVLSKTQCYKILKWWKPFLAKLSSSCFLSFWFIFYFLIKACFTHEQRDDSVQQDVCPWVWNTTNWWHSLVVSITETSVGCRHWCIGHVMLVSWET